MGIATMQGGGGLLLPVIDAMVEILCRWLLLLLLLLPCQSQPVLFQLEQRRGTRIVRSCICTSTGKQRRRSRCRYVRVTFRDTSTQPQVVRECSAALAPHTHAVCRWLSHAWTAPSHLVGPFIASLVQVRPLSPSSPIPPRPPPCVLTHHPPPPPPFPPLRPLAATVLSRTVSSASCARRVRHATSTVVVSPSSPVRNCSYCPLRGRRCRHAAPHALPRQNCNTLTLYLTGPARARVRGGTGLLALPEPARRSGLRRPVLHAVRCIVSMQTHHLPRPRCRCRYRGPCSRSNMRPSCIAIVIVVIIIIITISLQWLEHAALHVCRSERCRCHHQHLCHHHLMRPLLLPPAHAHARHPQLHRPPAVVLRITAAGCRRRRS